MVNFDCLFRRTGGGGSSYNPPLVVSSRPIESECQLKDLQHVGRIEENNEGPNGLPLELLNLGKSHQTSRG